MPQYSRDQLKRKFKREEKLRLPKIDMALSYAMRLDDQTLPEPEEPEKVPPKKQLKKKHKEKKSPPARRRRPRNNNINSPVQNILSDSDEEVSGRSRSRQRSRRASRPLQIIEEGEDTSVMMAIIRDNSLDRKIVL